MEFINFITAPSKKNRRALINWLFISTFTFFILITTLSFFSFFAYQELKRTKEYHQKNKYLFEPIEKIMQRQKSLLEEKNKLEQHSKEHANNNQETIYLATTVALFQHPIILQLKSLHINKKKLTASALIATLDEATELLKTIQKSSAIKSCQITSYKTFEDAVELQLEGLIK